MVEIRTRKAILIFAEQRGITGDWRTVKKVMIRRNCLTHDGKTPVVCEELFNESTEKLFKKE